MRRRWHTLVLVLLLSTAAFSRVSAHATLIRSVPPANAVLSQPPDVIRLWFSEALEPSYGSIDLLNSTGQKMATAEAVVDPQDATSMSVALGTLPDGVYTVAWHNVSRDDGHPLSGSFAFSIGQPAGIIATNPDDIDSQPPATRVAIQWLLLWFASILIGGNAFWLLIWTRAQPNDHTYTDAHKIADRWLRRLLWTAYIGLGVTILLSLWQQLTQVSTGVANAVDLSTLLKLLRTHFGTIWLARAAIWMGLGITLRAFSVPSQSRRQQATEWGMLVLGAVFLWTITLLSHGSSSAIAAATFAADWLHLLATSLWVGGLVAFALVLSALRGADMAADLRARLTQYFSNMARVAVASLLITGVYAAWLHVGTPDALASTRYGQTLLLKLTLIVPLLLIAAVNLLLTEPRLRAAALTDQPDQPTHQQTRWAAVLRGLVGVEVVLTALVLLVVGVLTSAVPSRSVIDAQAAASLATQEANVYADMQMTPAMHIILSISPAYAGTNNFTIGLYDLETSEAINDATLVKLQFTAIDLTIGKSQVQAISKGRGEYKYSGANLSVAGDWKIRVSVQRPNRYDEIVDFNVPVPPAPALPSTQEVLPLQREVLLILGLVAVASGTFFLIAIRQTWRSGGSLISLTLLICGIIFVSTGLLVGG